MSKYTAGPWTNEEGDITGIENDPENGCVGKVDVAHVYMRVVPGRSEANARLIAAAPELLEALIEVKQVLDMAIGMDLVPPSADGPAVSAAAAIAKATGEKA